eukprot:jgi/Botrbrau1/15447/Bobra.43_2s0071.2
MEVLLRHCPPCRTLEVGCGTNRLSFTLQKAGYRPLLAIDFSKTAVEQAKFAASKLPVDLQPDFAVMDMCNLDCSTSSFDLVMDKGTLDAIDCNGRTAEAVQEVARVLKPEGCFMCVSCRDPKERLPQLDAYFELKEQREVPSHDNPTTPCPNAYVYCLCRKANEVTP